MRILRRLLLVVAVTATVGAVGQGQAMATAYTGPVYRIQPPGSALAMNVQASVNTNSTGIQAVVKFWCFVPGTASGTRSCYRIDGEVSRLYRKSNPGTAGGGSDLLITSGPTWLNCRTDGGPSPCPSGVVQQNTYFAHPINHGYVYFGQAGHRDYPAYLQPASSAPGVWAAPSSGPKYVP